MPHRPGNVNAKTAERCWRAPLEGRDWAPAAPQVALCGPRSPAGCPLRPPQPRRLPSAAPAAPQVALSRVQVLRDLALGEVRERKGARWGDLLTRSGGIVSVGRLRPRLHSGAVETKAT